MPLDLPDLGEPPASPATSRLGVNLYGAAYHPDRRRAREQGVNNERNPGLGLRYQLDDNVFVEAANYKDSGSKRTSYAAIAKQWDVGPKTRLGAALAGFRPGTYNEGRPFVAPFPILTHDFGPAKLNATYIPKVRNLNEIDALGFYLTIPTDR